MSDPNVLTLARHLPALAEVRDACQALGWHQEYLLAAGLLLSLGALVEDSDPAHDAVHAVAETFARPRAARTEPLRTLLIGVALGVAGVLFYVVLIRGLLCR